MRRVMLLAVLLAAGPAVAQKPWETKVDLPVAVPVAIPALPPADPFATPVLSPPSPIATPLREKFAQTFTVQASAYVDSSGTLRRLVFTKTPWPSLEADLRQPLAALTFTPAQSGGAPVAVWLPLAVDLRGRIDEGQVTRLQATSPDPRVPPVADAEPVPSPNPQDADLVATPLTQVDQLPSPKRSRRIRIDGKTWHQSIRLLADVDADGHCRRVVFLSCPDGLRPWLLASIAGWTFRPAAVKSGPVEAWALLDGEIQVEVGTLSSETLRVTRTGSYPTAGAPAASGLPAGG
jgi:hypothetical protein